MESLQTPGIYKWCRRWLEQLHYSSLHKQALDMLFFIFWFRTKATWGEHGTYNCNYNLLQLSFLVTCLFQLLLRWHSLQAPAPYGPGSWGSYLLLHGGQQKEGVKGEYIRAQKLGRTEGGTHQVSQRGSSASQLPTALPIINYEDILKFFRTVHKRGKGNERG